jgi:hypothetical protein
VVTRKCHGSHTEGIAESGKGTQAQHDSRGGIVKVEWIEHKSKRILYVEYSGARNDDELIDILHKEVEIERQLTGKILCLVNVSDASAGRRYMQELKKLGREVRRNKVERTATIGVSGVKEILFKSYIAFTGETNKTFSSEKEARDWLVS